MCFYKRLPAYLIVFIFCSHSYSASVDNHETSSIDRRIVFVKEGGIGSGDSWEEAMGNLQEAINLTMEGFEGIDIWLAEGNYYPDNSSFSNKREASFILKNNVRIYGGFKGNETELAQRDIAVNVSRLSGEFNGTESILDNSYSVVRAIDLDSTTVLDGISISEGSSVNNKIPGLYGAGVNMENSDIIIRNVIIENNYAMTDGGGLFLDSSNPLFYRVRIINNKAIGLGAGACLVRSHPSFISCEIINNQVTGDFSGGGCYLNRSNPLFINSIIANNITGRIGEGGGIYCNYSSPIFQNSLVVNNWANDEGAGIYCLSGSHLEIINTIVWGNYGKSGLDNFSGYQKLSMKISNSNIQGGNLYGLSEDNYIDNIDETPRFLKVSQAYGVSNDALDANWNISPCSPCIDQGGISVSSHFLTEEDLRGNSRIYGDSVDIGPFEYIGQALTPSDTMFIYVAPDGKGDGSSFKNAMGDLQKALDTPLGCYVQKKIMLAEGIYIPDFSRKTYHLRANTGIYGVINSSWDPDSDLIQDKYLSILSGDIGQDGDDSNDAFHVVTCNYLDTSSIIDGVIIQEGNATKSSSRSTGGGGIICNHSNITIRNSLIRNNLAGNLGGGIYCNQSDIDVFNTQLFGNSSGSGGGGLYFLSSKPKLTNVMIINNEGNWAGGIELRKSKLKMINSIVANNEGDEAGGIFSVDSETSIINSTIVNNRGSFDEAGGIMCYDELIIQNSVIWGNKDNLGGNQIIRQPGGKLEIFNSNVEGGQQFNIEETAYRNNIDELPQFKYATRNAGLSDNAYSANWNLLPTSPCIDMGTLNGLDAHFPTTDLSGNKRVTGDSIDIGAYEYNDGLNAAHTMNYINDDLDGSVSLYPNPTSDNITIIAEVNNGHLKISLSSITGQLLYVTYIKSAERFMIPINGPSGVYLIEITGPSGERITKKIVKR